MKINTLKSSRVVLSLCNERIQNSCQLNHPDCNLLFFLLYPPEPVPQETSNGLTRASEGNGEWEELHRLHLLQSNHASMLINNVFLREGKYVLALSEKDLDALEITVEETKFVNEYIDALNKERYEKK